ncbi:MAG: hypothetical protein JKY27_08190 [Magnetovibrio sp.]|nr:hypothetical protein [Magnetovibrio sp.]
MRAHQILLIVSTTVLVSACSDFYNMVPRPLIKTVGNVSIISAGVTMATDKTLVDHIVSYRSGKDCSTVRTEQGRTYCREDEDNSMPEMYCYRSIADVTCYSEPNPARSETGLVGDVQ